MPWSVWLLSMGIAGFSRNWHLHSRIAPRDLRVALPVDPIPQYRVLRQMIPVEVEHLLCAPQWPRLWRFGNLFDRFIDLRKKFNAKSG